MTILLGFLIVSFAIWGIGDMFRGFVPNKVAEVGGAVDHRPAVPERDADRDVSRTRPRRSRNLTNAQAHALGLDREVLQRLIADAALDGAPPRSAWRFPKPRSPRRCAPIRACRTPPASSAPPASTRPCAIPASASAASSSARAGPICASRSNSADRRPRRAEAAGRRARPRRGADARDRLRRAAAAPRRATFPPPPTTR